MKILKKVLANLLLVGLLLPFSITHAEDIDIYDTSSGTVNNPNILVVLDNSSNWAAANQNWPTDSSPPVPCGNDCNKQGYYELKALRTLVNGLATTYGDANGDVPINIGLMLFNNSTATHGGGYVRSAVKPMTSTNRAALVAILNTIIENFNTETAASSVQYAAALFDVFKYFGGFTNPANATTDTAATPNLTYSSVHVFGTEFWGSNNADGTKPDSSAYSGINYVPVAAVSCGRNYIIFIGNGFPAKDDITSSDMSQVLKDLLTPSSPTTPISQFPIYNYSTSSSTPAASCSNVTTSPGNACQSNSTCSSNLSNSLYVTTSSTSTPTTTTNSITGVTTTSSTTTTTAYSCNSSASGCSGSTKNKIQGCTTNTITTTTGTPGQPSGNATGRYADEFTNFLNLTDVNSLTGQQNITTYVIDVYKAQQDLNQTSLMKNMAYYGGGKYFAASDLTQLSVAFDNILAEIQSVNSVFASSSLPVSVNTQGTYLNQVFVGMFRPDNSAKPRWYGNLKQYQFKIFNGTLRLADNSATPIEAINPLTGFITPCANSFWTTDTGSYWAFNSSSLTNFCNSSTKSSDAPDGATVEKGGAAQRLRGVTSSGTSTNYLTRALKTCNGSNGCSAGLTDFNTSNTTLTYTALGVTSGTESSLINWIRGQDVDNENNTTSVPNAVINEMRPSVHGGVVHSQPAVVDYGGTTGVVSFYGADDGVFHAINGNKTSTDGNELWGFIAPETYSKLHRLRDNSPIIDFPSFSSTITPTPTPKDYYFDGSIGVFQRSSTSTVWIYPTMRRGGRAIYGFDVSTPSSPSLKWRKGCFTNSTTDDTTCSSGWSGIGQTWSKPQVGYLNGYVDASGNPKPVLIFGGGYDTCEDTDSQTRCTTTPRKGANIWFVDADTGTVIRTYPTNYSVPGDVFLLTNSSGQVTYVYAADTGGYVYRINVDSYNGTTFGSAWTSNSAASNITIASLSQSGEARKFLFGPDVVTYIGFNAVLIGSGDREHPLVNSYACQNFSSSGVTNQFYMLKDTPSGYLSTPIAATDLTDVTTNASATIGTFGFRFSLVDPTANTPRCEQTVNKALTIGGTVYFGTNGPKTTSEKSGTCGSDLGNARGYAVDFLTGAAIADSRSTLYPAGGLPPSPVGGIVDVDGVMTPFCIGCTTPGDVNPSPLQGTPITINPVGPRKRVYWYLDTD